MMSAWETNAHYVEETFGAFVDFDEGFYHCPACEEPIYEVDWDEDELKHCICPICGFNDGEEDESY